MSDDMESRRRRAAWRASHRGTKELDILVGRYAEAELARMPETELALFEKFLAVPDPDLQDWLLTASVSPEPEFRDVVLAVRKFHGLV
jgi:antitoxin CptB